MKSEISLPTGLSCITSCACCKRSTTVELMAVGNTAHAVTTRPVCARCRREHGTARATLIARARVEPTFAQRCMQNMSATAAASFFMACGFKAADLPKLQMSNGPRKCSLKPRLYTAGKKLAAET